jgi:LPS sulfotransferase NodH
MPLRRFDAFVLFADMRTGSNHLQDSLNALPDVFCYGEVYNPSFMGEHNRFELFGYTIDRREADPIGLLDAMIAQTQGLPGFRLFHDHDDRVVARVLPDPRIAKVILTRNPLHSYVSRKIAAATGQWRLTDVRHRKTAKIRFDLAEFQGLVERQAAFQHRLRRGLQVSGQTAFHIRYDDINDAAVLNGLAAFLGSTGRLAAPPPKLKKQNPDELAEKVENYAEMVGALRDLDFFGLSDIHDVEPFHAIGVKGFVAHPQLGLLFMPIKGGPNRAVLDWMGALGGVGRDGLLRGLGQKELRQWMHDHPGHRSFSVLRHPVLRAYDSFCRFVLSDHAPHYAQARRILRNRYRLPIPVEAPGPDWDESSQRTAFVAFLDFLKVHLAGQTSLRVDAAWATQSALLQAMSQVATPHHLIREPELIQSLGDLTRALGIGGGPAVVAAASPLPIPLERIYDDQIETAAQRAYRRDYLNLGFRRFSQG